MDRRKFLKWSLSGLFSLGVMGRFSGSGCAAESATVLQPPEMSPEYFEYIENVLDGIYQNMGVPYEFLK